MNDAESAAEREDEKAQAELKEAVEKHRQARLRLAQTSRQIASLALLRGDTEKAERWERQAQEDEKRAEAYPTE